jgi:hypothetical protein
MHSKQVQLDSCSQAVVQESNGFIYSDVRIEVFSKQLRSVYHMFFQADQVFNCTKPDLDHSSHEEIRLILTCAISGCTSAFVDHVATWSESQRTQHVR